MCFDFVSLSKIFTHDKDLFKNQNTLRHAFLRNINPGIKVSIQFSTLNISKMFYNHVFKFMF